jgi:hypothetical protein
MIGASSQILSRRERIERFAGKLPRRIAYPLIFIISAALSCSILAILVFLFR